MSYGVDVGRKVIFEVNAVLASRQQVPMVAGLSND